LELESVARRLEEVGLIDSSTFQPLAWGKRQCRSDSDPTNNDRQRRFRNKQSVSNALHNAEVTATEVDKKKSRQEENPFVDADAPTPVEKSSNKIPNCPHEKLIALFHAEAKSLARVALLNESRRRSLSGIWKQVFINDKLEGEQAGLDYFDAYFNFVEQSDFLTGRANTKQPWQANFDWVINPKNFVKIIEGTYHRK
jgi:hypothetical protein